VEAKNGITEQIQSEYLLALLTTASHMTSHVGLSGSSSHTRNLCMHIAHLDV